VNVSNLEELLTDQQGIIEVWQERWVVFAKDPVVFELFWPQNDWKKIQTRLEHIESQMKKLHDNLRKCDLTGKGSFNKNLIKGIDTALRKRSSLDTKFEVIKKLVDALERQSNKLFKDHRPALQKDETVKTAYIHSLAHQSQLVRIALRTFKVSSELHNCCHRPHDLAMDLELNHFGPDVRSIDRGSLPKKLDAKPKSVSRPEAIAMSTADNALHHTFLVRDQEHAELVIRTRATMDSELDPGICRVTFQDALRSIVLERTATGGRCGLRLCYNGSLMLLREEMGNIQGDINDPEPLRDVLPVVHNNQGYQERMVFNLVKWKRAFELVEFGLLFLKTKWIHQICSCSIRQLRQSIVLAADNKGTGADPYRYTLQLVPSTRPGAAPPKHFSEKCWRNHIVDAAHYIQSRPLFYIGLVLIEIGLGTPIERVVAGGLPTRINLTFSNQADPEDIGGTIRKLVIPMGEKYSLAVQFCIESTETGEAVTEAYLTGYYWTVLAP